MKQYLNIANKIIDEGVWKNPSRSNMPRTKSINSEMMKFDLSDGFPIITTKKMFIRGVIEELLWMLKGDTNVKYLISNNIHIWDGDAYRYYKELGGTSLTMEEWYANLGKQAYEIDNHILGDLGKIYGYQWRKLSTEEGEVDQIINAINLIVNNPNSRRIIVEGWNPINFSNNKDAALPVCHKTMQFFVRDKYLDLNFYCRSQDFPLGTPFNISFYAIILIMFSKITGYKPGILTWIGGDVHIYENQIEQMKVQLDREPLPLPKLKINFDFDKYRTSKGYDFDAMINTLKYEDFELVDYKHHDVLKFPLSQGL